MVTRNPLHESEFYSSRKPTKPRIKELINRVDEVLKAFEPIPDAIQEILGEIEVIGMDALIREIQKFNEAEPFLIMARTKLQAALETKKAGRLKIAADWAGQKDRTPIPG